eukprot:CAMPEP_0181183682 /NCGR_PEP_ID=MMETSP1096-20121128/8555_1 /TAXON_ID=156174 ORGANISM="Chrysochromulina ericina, Strain CCMP281" /NCGR_SAMPLE_ID=MMETSP1096 /ASSEMBLY_ACC=CAM_ASM_000453 /LENGTH=42 /DNA_ID= /DNA_START= /DNA_END= /DNA_ORIENTATION=
MARITRGVAVMGELNHRVHTISTTVVALLASFSSLELGMWCW